jgi:hypothetical protein
MSFKKYEYVRSKELLKKVASLDCQICGSGNFVQAAHSNWVDLGGKGRGIKASDEYTAALCMSCHYDIDQGSKWSKDERKLAWKVAHYKTVQLLVHRGEWPVNINVPIAVE